MLLDLVERFVDEQLAPLEQDFMERVTAGEPAALRPDDEERLFALCKEIGLFALDAPEEVGGAAMPARVDDGDQRASPPYRDPLPLPARLAPTFTC